LKGMKHSDKLNMIQMLNVIPVIQNIDVSDDEEFEENIAKLINNVGLELSFSFDDPDFSDSEKYSAMQLLDSIFPLLIKYLGNEYDDTCQALFPFTSQFLSTIKKNKSQIDLATIKKLKELIKVLISKLKYDSNDKYRLSSEQSEEDALFLDLRKSIKIHLETIASIEPTVFSDYISNYVCEVFGTLQVNRDSVDWTRVELALYLVYIYAESKTLKGQIQFKNLDDSYTPIGLMLCKMIDSSKNNTLVRFVQLSPSISANYLF
jgi:exportin-T